MEIIEFACLTILLVLFTGSWLFIFIVDGAFGDSRDIPIYVMVLILFVVIYFWVKSFDNSIFSITLN